MKLILPGLIALTLFIGLVNAQQPSPAPIVVQAAPLSGADAPVTAPAAESPSFANEIKALQEVKAANDETLKKQEATLVQLDEMLKAAEQLKIFSKRS